MRSSSGGGLDGRACLRKREPRTAPLPDAPAARSSKDPGVAPAAGLAGGAQRFASEGRRPDTRFSPVRQDGGLVPHERPETLSQEYMTTRCSSGAANAPRRQTIKTHQNPSRTGQHRQCDVTSGYRLLSVKDQEPHRAIAAQPSPRDPQVRVRPRHGPGPTQNRGHGEGVVHRCGGRPGCPRRPIRPMPRPGPILQAGCARLQAASTGRPSM